MISSFIQSSRCARESPPPHVGTGRHSTPAVPPWLPAISRTTLIGRDHALPC